MRLMRLIIVSFPRTDNPFGTSLLYPVHVSWAVDQGLVSTADKARACPPPCETWPDVTEPGGAWRVRASDRGCLFGSECLRRRVALVPPARNGQGESLLVLLVLSLSAFYAATPSVMAWL